MIGIIILIIVVVVLCALSCYLAHYAAGGARYTLAQTFADQEKQNPEVESLRKARHENYDITSFDGFTLHVEYYPLEAGDRVVGEKKPDGTLLSGTEEAAAEKGVDEAVLKAPAGYTKKFLIMVHGYTLNRYGELKYMPLYRRLGYNIIIYDHRGHGESAKAPCSFGIREARDLIAVINDTYQRYGKDIWLGLTGESLGAATEITALKYHPNVKFLVNDCGFSELMPVEKDGLKGLHLPTWLFYLADLACRPMYGYFFHKANPIESLKDNKIPICFIHGTDDTFITPDHSERMAKATQGYQELHLVKGAAHAKSINVGPAEYEKIVDTFVKGVEEGKIR